MNHLIKSPCSSNVIIYIAPEIIVLDCYCFILFPQCHITVSLSVVSIARVNRTLSILLRMEILKAFILLACSVYATCAEESSACAAVATEETNLYGTLSVLTDQQPNGTVLLRMTPNFDMNISVVWKYAFKYDSVASARTVTPNNTNFRLYENGALYLMLINASIDYNETYFWVEQSDRRIVMSPFIQLILKGKCKTNTNKDADHTLFPLVLSSTIGICVVFFLFIGTLIFFISAIMKTAYVDDQGVTVVFGAHGR
ncbi:uncharacterized protein LOC128219420 isoform X2 [Mya arenaria]|uniref:uncharacterized protein LOC128219420 isoform X2 n=1 Tax=Mya arenaria TaxID=6604 RepID=UPI0022E43FBA|nr:uncharacterized protein LOC128219420 isoform X2 [Mya arenaria]